MQITPQTKMEVSKAYTVVSSDIRCFTETPRKTGQEKTIARIGAFDLFNLFTADIIRSKEVFVR